MFLKVTGTMIEFNLPNSFGLLQRHRFGLPLAALIALIFVAPLLGDDPTDELLG